ncbi:MAG: hypothetical protein H6815_06520 [Phycisphaeraceae bacterium]|nr:hypothetical protein [Phycisphaerales bacterium]MCB9860092.1 hypothetical protein [Phycisphaeraceae bacterium]
MRHLNQRQASFTIALFLLSAGSSTVLAQNALDANLRQGSGGLNSPGQSPLQPYQQGNDVVTGNATNGRAFRGDVGYGAAGDFRGDLGSNDLFTFRRDAFLSGLITSGIGTREAVSQLATSTLGQGTSTPLQAFSSLPRSGAGSLYDARTRTIEQTPSLQSAFGSFKGIPQISTGLAGITQQQNGDTGIQNPLAVESGFALSGEPNETSDANADWQVGNQIILSFGDQLRTRSNETVTLTQAQDRIAQFNAQALAKPGQPLYNPQFNQTPINPFTEESAYASILDQFRNKPQETSTGQTWEQQLSDALAKFDEEIAQSRQLASINRKPGESEPSATQGMGLRSDIDPTGAAPSLPKFSTQAEEDSREYFSAITGEYIGKLALSPDFVRSMSQDVGAISTLVLQTSETMASVYRNEMESAQTELKAERYFAAEERFKRAINAQPADPMARIGRVHAQLGAGLYISAGINLVEVFKTHPELVGIRYDTTLLPSASRWNSIKDELLNAMNTPGSLATEASMLYAYMAYQFGDKEAVMLGATRMVELKPDDKIYRLAATVWASSFDRPSESATPER